jgi:tetratricopeptide (TPR) repeat protein
MLEESAGTQSLIRIIRRVRVATRSMWARRSGPLLLVAGLGGCNIVGDADTMQCAALSISACTALIQSPFVTGRRLAAAYVHRGIAYNGKAQYDLAIQDFGQAIQIDPTDSIAFYDRGKSYFGEGQYEHAIQDFSQAIQLTPSPHYFLLAYIDRGTAYDRIGQHDRAVQDYNRALELNPQNAKGLIPKLPPSNE